MISFNTYGHPNILASHKNTVEFTKDKELSLNGDCILGVNSDFDLEELKKFIRGKAKIKVDIEVDDVKDSFECNVNPKFDDSEEIVFRLGEFDSSRTLGLRSTKAAKHINREIVEKMKNNGKMKVTISALP